MLLIAPEVTRTPPPAPDAVGPLIGGLAILITVLSLVWIGFRKLRRYGPKDGVRSSSGGAAIGNALFEMGSVLQPDRPNVEVIVKLEEEVLEDEVGDRRNPGRKPTPPRHEGKPTESRAVGSGPEGDEVFKPSVDSADEPLGGHEHL